MESRSRHGKYKRHILFEVIFDVLSERLILGLEKIMMVLRKKEGQCDLFLSTCLKMSSSLENISMRAELTLVSILNMFGLKTS